MPRPWLSIRQHVICTGNEQKAPPGSARSAILRNGSNQTGTTVLCHLVSLPQTFSPNPEGGDGDSDGLLKHVVNLPFCNWQASGWNLDDGEASTLMTQRMACKWTHPRFETQWENETFCFYRHSGCTMTSQLKNLFQRRPSVQGPSLIQFCIFSTVFCSEEVLKKSCFIWSEGSRSLLPDSMHS